MATSDIQKLAVYDARIVQPTSRFAVGKGALAVTNSPYNAISATPSQVTVNINAPSQNVFVARDIDWQCKDVIVKFSVATTGVSGEPIACYGADFALAPYPLHSMVQTMTTTINDTNTTINLGDVFDPVTRLVDCQRNRLIKNSPSYLDTYAKYDDSKGAINDPLGGYQNSTVYENQPNGAWPEWQFCDPSTGEGFGVPGRGVTKTYTVANVTVSVVAGIPTIAANPTATTYPLAIKFNSTERVMIPPFIFNDEYEGSVGLYGINNIQFIMNMKSNVDRVIRWRSNVRGTGVNARIFSAVSLSSLGSVKLQVQYLTPSLDVPLPAKSSVPYLEFPRYVNASLADIPANSVATNVQSQTIVLPQIPDMLLIYAKPQRIGGVEPDGRYGDAMLPIEKISLNFDNVAGLLSSHTKEELYRYTVNNGLNMPYDQWLGYANVVNGTTSSVLQTSGGFLVLRPGKDFALQTGQSPSLLGNFVVQFNVDIVNTFGSAVTPALYVVAVNSGFFETMAGSSRVLKGILSEQDILNAPMVADDMSLQRLVGAGWMDKLGSFLSKAKDIYTQTKPMVSQIKGMLPESGLAGKVKGALDSVGYGAAGAGLAGAGKHRKSISARLM